MLTHTDHMVDASEFVRFADSQSAEDLLRVSILQTLRWGGLDTLGPPKKQDLQFSERLMIRNRKEL